MASGLLIIDVIDLVGTSCWFLQERSSSATLATQPLGKPGPGERVPNQERSWKGHRYFFLLTCTLSALGVKAAIPGAWENE